MQEVKLIDANALHDKVSRMGLQNGSVLGHHSGTADVIAEMIQNTPTINPETLPEEEPCQKWHPASEIPPLHHEVDEDKCEGALECDVSEPLLLYTEEEGYKVGVYMKDCYGFNGWLNPDNGGTIRHVVEWQYPPKPSKKRSEG